MAWTLVQHVDTINTASPATSVTVTLTSTGANHLLVVLLYQYVTSGGGITSITGTSESWVNGANLVVSAGGSTIDGWYALNSVGGSTSLTVNFASNTAGMNAASVFEFAHAAGAPTLDAKGNATDTSGAANPAGIGLTLTGTNDVIVQAVSMNTDPTAISGAYATHYTDVRFGISNAFALDQTTGTAPTWTAAAGGQEAELIAFAFTEASATFSHAPLLNPLSPFPRLGIEYRNRTGWQVSPTTHTHTQAATNIVEMWQGQRPPSPVLFTSRNRQGQQLSQTTHVQANTTAENMWLGNKPDRPRLPFVGRPGWTVSQTTHTPAPFSTDMVVADRPTSPRLPFVSKPGWAVSQTTHTPVPLSDEMVRGSKPDQPRPPFRPHEGWSTSQLTHVPAPLTNEMVWGWKPDIKAPLPFRAHEGWQTLPPFIFIFEFEGLISSFPASPRLPFIAKVGWMHSQTTHVPTPLTDEMVWGQKPDIKAPLPFKAHEGWSISQTTHVSAPLTDEMVRGWTPDQPRLPFKAHDGWTISQLTFDAAPVTNEMMQGLMPDRRRETIRRMVELVGPLAFPVFAFEGIIGYQPDLPRLFVIPRRAGWVSSQTTHNPAPFGYEMVSGSQPVAARLPVGLSQHRQVFLFNAESGMSISVLNVDSDLSGKTLVTAEGNRMITGVFTFSNNLLFTDATYDIGASGASRPRNIYQSGDLTTGGNASVTGTLSVTGAVTLTSTLAVTGTSTLTGAVTTSGLLTANLAASKTLALNSTGVNGPYSVWQGSGADLFYIGQSEAIGGAGGNFNVWTAGAKGLSLGTNNANALSFSTTQIATFAQQVNFKNSAVQIDGLGVSMTTWGTTASATNAVVTDADYLKRSTSSLAYKDVDHTLTPAEARGMLMAMPLGIVYRGKHEVDRRPYLGWGAEDVAPRVPVLANYDQPMMQGAPNYVEYDRVSVLLTAVAQEHERRLIDLEARLR